MKHAAPFVFAFVLTLAFLLMLVTFRSVVVAVKAVLLNLLSVAAAYGALVLVFQNGWGKGLLGFVPPGGIISFLPIFLFVILFGLSMDYHVFILSRVREAFDRGMTTEDAVAHGIKSTAGVVTSAALVMFGVFAIFATLQFMFLKEFGVGLADRRPRRRDDRPRSPAARDDEAARRLELVPAAVARVAAGLEHGSSSERSRRRTSLGVQRPATGGHLGASPLSPARHGRGPGEARPTRPSPEAKPHHGTEVHDEPHDRPRPIPKTAAGDARWVELIALIIGCLTAAILVVTAAAAAPSFSSRRRRCRKRRRARGRWRPRCRRARPRREPHPQHHQRTRRDPYEGADPSERPLPSRQRRQDLHRDRRPATRRRRQAPPRRRRALAARSRPTRRRDHHPPAPQPHERARRLRIRPDRARPLPRGRPRPPLGAAQARPDRRSPPAAVRPWNGRVVLEHQLPARGPDRRGPHRPHARERAQAAHLPTIAPPARASRRPPGCRARTRMATS